MRGSSGKVVLFFPSYVTEEIAPPLALIAIAGPLLKAGFEVVIVDASLEDDPVPQVLAHLDGAVCLGVSIITGPMIADTIAVCEAAKAAHPGVPIVLGGWHPSIMPAQTLAADFVDAVVVNQGEVPFLQMVRRLAEGDAIGQIPGVLYKEPGGSVVHGGPVVSTGVDHLHERIPGYELIDYDRYAARTGLRWVMYTGSHGCPFDCSYCSNASVYGRRLSLLPAEQVVDEVTWLVRRYGIQLLGLIDDIFFAFRPRSLEIAEGFLRSGLKFEWYIQDRADSIARLSAGQAAMLRRSGLARVHFGAESGSDDVLKSIEKQSTVARTLEALERCKAADIRASFGFIFGLPDETEADMRATVDLIARIYQIWDRADCHTNIFTPYPGSPLWPRSLELGVQAPESLQAWVDFFPRVTELPWLEGAQHQRLQRVRQYLRFGYPNVRVGEDGGSWRHRLALAVFGPAARWRLDNHRYSYPLELRAYDAARRLKPNWNVYERI